ncbi:hypothetical protein ASE12_06755 [Aeromicrobium sp. Root236]|uniref:hypothetical protein n=1 Tax=Aeromicrobium sp. Root236 TaxID=1736498 RepID=UPI0006FDEB1B|nr:hypothetical protein [Aeromicrobium sp. Root236]KRC64495.1 hypothetical protein ASE12_06755 [Aeromicrobium sp. Root236]
MTTHRWAPAAALAAAALSLSATAATADVAPPPPSADFAGHLVAGPGATTVKIRYSCTTSADAPLSHLYVGVKQGPHVNTEEGSTSASADTFYSTNWKSDAGPNALRCDGARHTQTLVLKPQPGFVAKVRRLHAGPALVQICVFDNVTAFGEEGPVDGGFAFSYTMERVRSGHR